MTTPPALLAISHGTSSPAGQAAVAALVEAVARGLPDVTVRLGHVDVQQPDVAASLDAIPEGTPVVIVPLLLSAGYHVRVDLRQQSAGRDGVVIAPALGPDPRLVDVLLARLTPLAPAPDDEIVLAVAGSSDDRANEDCREIGRMLGARLGRDVGVGFLAAADPRLDVAVARPSPRRPRAPWSRTTSSPRGTSTTSPCGWRPAPPWRRRCSATTSPRRRWSTSSWTATGTPRHARSDTAGAASARSAEPAVDVVERARVDRVGEHRVGVAVLDDRTGRALRRRGRTRTAATRAAPAACCA